MVERILRGNRAHRPSVPPKFKLGKKNEREAYENRPRSPLSISEQVGKRETTPAGPRLINPFSPMSMSLSISLGKTMSQAKVFHPYNRECRCISSFGCTLAWHLPNARTSRGRATTTVTVLAQASVQRTVGLFYGLTLPALSAESSHRVSGKSAINDLQRTATLESDSSQAEVQPEVRPQPFSLTYEAAFNIFRARNNSG